MKPDDSESRFEIVPWFHGKILDFSDHKTFAHFIWYMDARIDEPYELPYSDHSLDGVMSSNILPLMPKVDAVKTLREWARVVKPGGNIILHGEWTREAVERLMTSVNGWDMAYCQRLESGLLAVFRMGSGVDAPSCDKPKPEKTCGIVRLGAFGDMIQASSIFPWLKAQGYHITLYTSDHGYPVVKHDPHVDRFIIQGANEVPPQALGAFWEHERKKYDKWVNLSESVECSLLPGPGSSAFDWPSSVREKYMDRNYLEFTHEIAEVPPPYLPKFYSTRDEREWARFQKRKMGRRNVLWSLSGSSPHKMWPHMDAVIARILLEDDGTHVVLVGDEISQILEAGWARPDGEPPHPRAHCRSGKWSIRQSMAFAEVADLIIGTETGLLNAAGSMDTPKIVTLSHSSANMLTKHWKNAISLTQPKGGGCPKSPCRQLHADRQHCPFHEDENVKAALCQWHITADMMWSAVRDVLSVAKRQAA